MRWKKHGEQKKVRCATRLSLLANVYFPPYFLPMFLQCRTLKQVQPSGSKSRTNLDDKVQPRILYLWEDGMLYIPWMDIDPT